MLNQILTAVILLIGWDVHKGAKEKPADVAGRDLSEKNIAAVK